MLTAALSFSAFAQESSDNIQGDSAAPIRSGVWRGTLGQSNVVVCLEKIGSGYFYDMQNMFDVLMDSNKDDSTWIEVGTFSSHPVSIWKLGIPHEDRLDGEWSDADGGQRLPVHLDRVLTLQDENQGCYSGGDWKSAYNAPRVGAQKLVVSESKFLVLKISAMNGQIAWIELSDTARNAAQFNKAMRDWFENQIAEFYENARSAVFYRDSFSQEIEVIFQSSPWLVLEGSYDQCCLGTGAEKGSVSGYQIWNLEAGQYLEPATWIRGAATREDGSVTVPEDLNRLILSRTTYQRDDEDCSEVVFGDVVY